MAKKLKQPKSSAARAPRREAEDLESTRARYLKELAHAPTRQPQFLTSSGVPLDPLYTPEALENLDYLRELGFPGQYPFTRGIYPTMYRGRLWTMRQYAGFGTAEETNQRFHYLLSHGQTGLSVAFDLPTQMGYDADHPLAQGEVGRTGVSICSLEDMRTLVAGIPLDRVSLSMTINATAAILFAMVLAVAEERGIPFQQLSGTVQNDILKEYIARKTYVFPPRPSMRLVTDVIRFCVDHQLNWNPISISGYHIREAGATAVQEVAFTFANAIAYVEAAQAAGLMVDQFAPRLSFFFGAHNHLLEEVAKFRAARRLWARIVRERFQAQDEASGRLRFHTQTDGSTLTAQEPENNVVRVTLQALAGVLGGTQSLHTNAYDEALTLPSEEAARLALRTQQIVGYESGVADTIDPLGGSYYVEWLTRELEAKIQAYLDRIQALGGAEAAIESGFFQQEIHQSAYRYQQRLEAAEVTVVGVNRFQSPEPAPASPSPGSESARGVPFEEIEARQRTRLKALRAQRDPQQVEAAMTALRGAAAGQENLVPAILSACRARVTLGESCQALEEAWGRYREPGLF